MSGSNRFALMSILGNAFGWRSRTILYNQKAAVVGVVNKYYEAFIKNDVLHALELHDEPLLLIAATGITATVTHDEGAKWFAKAHDVLPTDYSYSKFTNVQIKELSGALAIASGIDVKYSSSGNELQRSGSTYVLRKTSTGWRVAAILEHDPINALG
jgi:hypothetical protein